jgi:hypothetical protein
MDSCIECSMRKMCSRIVVIDNQGKGVLGTGDGRIDIGELAREMVQQLKADGVPRLSYYLYNGAFIELQTYLQPD